jgi:hypothetical protein
MPAASIRDLLPASMNTGAWQTLARLKEQWGVSIQALLYRARWLGRLSDVSYRNAMTTLTGRGWRRHEPGQMTVPEQPSLLPRAVELLAADGIGEARLIEQCRAPAGLFRTVTARAPLPALAMAAGAGDAHDDRVVSLLSRLPHGLACDT